MLEFLRANAVVMEMSIALVVAPIAGVLLARRSGALSRGASVFVAGVAVFVLACGTADAFTSSQVVWPLVVESQTTVAAAALALGAIGACAATLFADVLDAAALSLSLALLCGFGVFLAGAPLAELPTQALNAALLANPIVAASSAANIDLFREAFLYQHSPVAHRLFAYPTWHSASAIYAVTAAGLLVMARGLRRRRLRSIS